jgi:hypothetical protein
MAQNQIDKPLLIKKFHQGDRFRHGKKPALAVSSAGLSADNSPIP